MLEDVRGELYPTALPALVLGCLRTSEINYILLPYPSCWDDWGHQRLTISYCLIPHVGMVEDVRDELRGYFRNECIIDLKWSRHWKTVDPRTEGKLNLHPERPAFLSMWKQNKITWCKIWGVGRVRQSSNVSLREILSYQLWLVCRCVIVKTFDSTHEWGCWSFFVVFAQLQKNTYSLCSVLPLDAALHGFCKHNALWVKNIM